MKFEIYKKSQGRKARLIAMTLIGIIAVIGCSSLRRQLMAVFDPLILGDIAIDWADIIAGTLFLVCAAAVLLVMNSPRVADFLIETEAEMRKVAWSSRHEVAVATVVVVITVFLLGIYLFVVDQVLTGVLRLIRVL